MIQYARFKVWHGKAWHGTRYLHRQSGSEWSLGEKVRSTEEIQQVASTGTSMEQNSFVIGRDRK